MGANDYYRYDKIKKTKYGYFINDSNILPVQVNQAYEEIRKKERDLGMMLMLQKDREGRFP